MLWIYSASASYFFFALTSIINRLLLAGPLPSAGAYAFTIAAAGIFTVFLIPFGFIVPSAPVIALAFLGGIAGIVAFLAYYQAIRLAAVSRIAPTVGAFQPIFTLVISALLVPQEFALTGKVLLAVVLLIAGTILLSIRAHDTAFSPHGRFGTFLAVFFPFRRSQNKHSPFAQTELRYAFLAALFFSLSLVLTKLVYRDIGFLNGLIWTNLGSFLVAPVLLLSPSVRNTLRSPAIWRKRFVLIPLMFEKSIGALGALLQQYSIFLVAYSQLALVHAMQGLQYVFLLFFVSLLALWKPELLREELTRRTLPYRAAGTLAIAAGLYVIVT